MIFQQFLILRNVAVFYGCPVFSDPPPPAFRCFSLPAHYRSVDLLDAPDAAHEQVPIQVRARLAPQVQLRGDALAVGLDRLQPSRRLPPGDASNLQGSMYVVILT